MLQSLFSRMKKEAAAFAAAAASAHVRRRVRELMRGTSVGCASCAMVAAAAGCTRAGIGKRIVPSSSLHWTTEVSHCTAWGSARNGGGSPLARLFSTSAAARDKDMQTDTRTSPKLAAATLLPKASPAIVVLVKVGDSKWSPFKDDEAMTMDRIDLLEALAGSKVFGSYLKGVDKLADCTIDCGKLPRDKDEPTAEDASKFGELKGAKTVGASAGSSVTGGEEQICIRVRLPGVTGASSRALHDAQTVWRSKVATSFTVEDVSSAAAAVASCALDDMALTVDKLAALWGSPVAKILQRPIPFDRSSQDGPAAMLELLEPAAAAPSAEPLFKEVWAKLQTSMDSTAQRKFMVLLTGVSGAGKSKVAFDIGREHAFVVLVRVWEGGLLTPPWQTLAEVTTLLQTQAQRAKRTRASLLPVVSERMSSIAAILLLLSCHMEWAVMVYMAASAAAAGSAADPRNLREAILRAQRNGTGQRNADVLFRLRLREVMEGNMDAYGRVVVPIDAALARFRQLRATLPHGVPVVWCYDEVQVLLTHSQFGSFFAGTFTAADFKDAGAAAAPAPGPPSLDTASRRKRRASTTAAEQLTFSALSADIDACNAEIHESGSRGLFYGLLVAVRHLMRDFRWGHLLCGSSLRLNRELLMAHSPAQGVAECVDANMRFDARSLRAWLSGYLTPEAATGLDDASLSALAGRPLFASCVFAELHSTVSHPTAELLAAAPAAVVAAAVQRATARATEGARMRVEELWERKFPTATGMQPQRLVAWLYYLQRMGFNPTTAITPPSMSAEVMDTVQRGVLHVGRDSAVINLQDEPITAAAILKEGDKRTAAVDTFAQDSVLSALARRVTGEFGDDGSKGTTAEEVIAWTLLCTARSGPIPLQALLSDFLGPDPLELFPESLRDHTVHLDRGLACNIALGPDAANRTFLELLAQPGGDKLLLHRTQHTAAGADLAFLAQRPGATAGSKPRQRLVIVQVKNAASATAADMLPSVDLGQWYPDTTRKRRGAADEKVESGSHRALRRVLAANPEWADPVRVMVSARRWAEVTKQTAAWINMVKVPAQPLLLAQLSEASVGVNVGQSAASSAVHPPEDSLRWWPTRIRHWPDSRKHPQADTLPLAPATAPAVQPCSRVRFSVGGSVPALELKAVVTASRVHRVVHATNTSLEVDFSSLKHAMLAVAEAEASLLRVGGFVVTADFVR